MNKNELIVAVATKMNVSKTNASGIIETVIGTIIDAAIADGECVVPGLGKVLKVKRAARSGVTNGVEWKKEAGETLKLRLSKSGKELV